MSELVASPSGCTRAGCWWRQGPRPDPPCPRVLLAGLCALSINNDNCYLAYPGSATIGEVQVFDTINLVRLWGRGAAPLLPQAGASCPSLPLPWLSGSIPDSHRGLLVAERVGSVCFQPAPVPALPLY